ncbi:MAG: mannitol dehydrogenase family protein [Actinobacteria bacterium]|nr:mannitol dehydrogenase family protein [Propionicimonas sp.]MBU3976326.1 mannitol dehydrogenase family protein [Actinomycetota bacterium]MBU3987483.1 mannitol dehydrogenase family protein [Actinomycetota bacterium]MBU4006572.1 mannitol dehydrogenase family protein [Actinomycetota bacterium]MBU4065177.1 mannitol dehydrogenase family protein [Actinomycetota bacterium]
MAQAQTRLSRESVTRLDPAARPLVEPQSLRPRILHFGLGAFHRAHQAVYTEAANAACGERWGIVDVEPFSSRAVEEMRAQDCLYSVTDRAPGDLRTRVVGSVIEALLLSEDPGRVRELLTDADLGTVTLTVTEKGYHRRLDTGGLDTTAAPIVTDLAATASEGAPLATVLGQLSAGLRARFHSTAAPIDLISCDNMAGNGPALATVVRGFIEASAWADKDALLAWMADSVSFPATIVDRIVPATTDDDRNLASSALGLRDEMPVLGEPYRQWVLEDAFVGPRPHWDRGGALYVPDVAPYQLMKLRLLNGSHSAMAYLGLAAGCRTVADVLATDWGESLVRAFGSEVAPTLPRAGTDPAAYVEDLVVRFRNPAMHHLLRQIGSDGTLKLPERWFGPLRELRANGRPAPVLELALAAWVHATVPHTDGGQRYGTVDPASPALAACWSGSMTPTRRVAALLTAAGAEDLAAATDLTAAIAQRLDGVAAGRVEL